MKNITKIIISTIIIFTYGCSGSSEQSAEANVEAEPISSSERSQKVIEHHLGSFGANDLAEIMTDYTEESIVVNQDSMYVGLEQIESLFVGLLPAFPTEGTTMELDRMVVENELVYVIWHATTPSLEVSLGTDTFIVENDKIMRQTFAVVIKPLE